MALGVFPRPNSQSYASFTVPLSTQLLFPFFLIRKEVRDSRFLARGIFTLVKGSSGKKAMLNTNKRIANGGLQTRGYSGGTGKLEFHLLGMCSG